MKVTVIKFRLSHSDMMIYMIFFKILHSLFLLYKYQR